MSENSLSNTRAINCILEYIYIYTFLKNDTTIHKDLSQINFAVIQFSFFIKYHFPLIGRHGDRSTTRND